MSKFLGINVKPKDVAIYEFWQLREWVGIPNHMVKKAKAGKYKKFILVEASYHKKLKEVVFESTPPIKEWFDADFVIVNNSEINPEEFNRCVIKACMPNGGCQSIEVISNSCADECSSNANCAQPCFYNTCENGMCVPTMTHQSPPCPDPMGECTSSINCAQDGTNTTCTVYICTVTGHCWPTYVQINDEEESCPPNECESDDECGTMDDDDEGLLSTITEMMSF